MSTKIWKPSFTIGGNVNWYSHYGKQNCGYSKKKKIELSYDPTFGYLSQGYENTNANRYMHPQHYLQ